jgi:hypothetical protein
MAFFFPIFFRLNLIEHIMLLAQISEDIDEGFKTIMTFLLQVNTVLAHHLFVDCDCIIVLEPGLTTLFSLQIAFIFDALWIDNCHT